MLQTATCEQLVSCNELLDDRVIRIALLAVIIDNTRRPTFAIRTKARRILGVIAIIANRERNARINATRFQLTRAVHPCFKVFSSVAWGGVHETGASIVGDVVTRNQWHDEFVSAAETLERMIEYILGKLFARHIAQALKLKLCLLGAFVSQFISEDKLFAGTWAKIILSGSDFIKAVCNTRRIGHSTVSGNGPWSCRPDNDRAADQIASICDRELHPDHIRLDVVIFDFGFCKGCAFNHRPHDRF